MTDVTTQVRPGRAEPDIEALAGAIRADVADRYGVELEQEPVRVV